MRKASYLFFFLVIGLFIACSDNNRQSEQEEWSINKVAEAFDNPPMEYRPYVWWHWMGPNFSKEGITKDLEAMKEAGIGGATIFNIASAVQETHAPTENNPWPNQTYRSDAYWEALTHAAAEAQRLGLSIGLHNTPGYSTTGGPWVTEEKAMQTIVCSEIKVKGPQEIKQKLNIPELPVYDGWGSSHTRASFYRDIAVIAVPDMEKPDITEVMDVSKHMDADGNFQWSAPEGNWTIYRIGHAPTMSNPHPLPDDLIGKILEVDKMSLEYNRYHWDQILTPLVEHLKPYIGKSFTHILIDSYEAGNQNWTEDFRDIFQTQKGYDPVLWIALQQRYGEQPEFQSFIDDQKEVINRLYVDHGWKTAQEKVNEAGLQLCFEPYWGPFDVYEGASLADVPMGEFWNTSDGSIVPDIVRAAKDLHKRVVGAEAMTGQPKNSRYTEDPAFLKHSTDGAFHHGVNRLYLHHWVHQPFDDRYQPGMGMGWWGTHFSRFQTWFEPGKAFFKYISRCQMMLQQGVLDTIYDNVLHRHLKDADLFFVNNSKDTVWSKRMAFKAKSSTPQLWRADTGSIQSIHDFKTVGDSTYVALSLQPDESVFVVFPLQCKYTNKVMPDYKVESEISHPLGKIWEVTFEPKLDNTFTRSFPTLYDFSTSDDPEIKYFSGTATYKQSFSIEDRSIQPDKHFILNLGTMNDIAEIWVNGEHVGVCWYPPYIIDITPFIKADVNEVTIAVTNNWANLLIGDEQYPADFEWGEERGEELGRAMKAYPDWFIQNKPRPSQRKSFSVWYYYRKDSPLQPAGLVGPVSIIEQNIKRFP